VQPSGVRCPLSDLQRRVCYQLQAAIAALHDEAASTEQTDRAQIHALYGLLERMGNNPMVTLSRAVAAAMVEGPEAGLPVKNYLLGKATRLATSTQQVL